MAIALFNRIRPRAQEPVVETEKPSQDAEVSATGATARASLDEKDPSRFAHSDDDASTDDGETQDGVKGVEAITSVWTKRTLFFVYLMYVLLDPGNDSSLTYCPI